MAWLRERLKKTQILVLPSVFDGLSTKLLQHAGFEAAYCSGFVTAASSYGFPDIGLLDATEMRTHYIRICGTTDLPVIVDGDTGYGGVLNVFRTVELLAKTGVSAIHIEDQKSPKRCGHLKGRTVVDRSEAYERIWAAVEAGKKYNVDIIARTDALTTLGVDEAVLRSNEFMKIGATATFVDGLSRLSHISSIPSLIEGPVLFNSALFADTNAFTTTEISDFGYKMVIYPGDLLCCAMTAVQKKLSEMLRGNYKATQDEITLDDINVLTAQDNYLMREKDFAKQLYKQDKF